MITLFKCSTGEDWPIHMFDVTNTTDFCIEGSTCGTFFGYLFFLMFVMVVQYIMLNLFILILI